MTLLSKKTVLITGCSAGGIGAALAFAFHDAGYHIFATARQTAKIPESLSKLPDVTVLQLDVVSSPSIAAAVVEVSKATGGKLDVLVNNSGVGYYMPGLDIDIEKAKAVFDTNFFSMIAVMQAFAPLLVKAKGALVNNSSVAGELPGMYESVYGSSKAAITHATETWRLELAPFGVRVITLITGAVKSEFLSNEAVAELREGSYYEPVADFLRTNAARMRGFNPLPTDGYAKQVVKAIDAGATGKVWAGTYAGSFKWFKWCMPTWLWDWITLDMNKDGVSPLYKLNSTR